MKYLRKPFKYHYYSFYSNLIAINILAYFICGFLTKTHIFPVDIYLSLIPVLVIKKYMFWQVFTYQFMHGGFYHLFLNMLTLFFFAPELEKKMGSSEFILFYLLSGTICGILSCLLYYVSGYGQVMLVGASGTIFAVLLCYAVLFPHSLIYLWGLVPIPAPVLIIGYFVIEIFSIFTSNDNVSHLAHLTGIFAGWLYIKLRFGIDPLKVWGFKMH